MNFCKECGDKIENTQQVFCVNCGAAISDNEDNGELQNMEVHQDNPTRSNSGPVKVRTEMTKKQKRNTGIGAAILVLFIGLYFIGDHFTSESRLINQFSDAIGEKDSEKLAKLVSFSSLDGKIGKENAKAFLSLLDDKPEEKQAIIEQLQMQSSQTSYAATIEWMQEDSMVSLVKGDGFLFYDTYELVIEPRYITLNTNVKDAKLFVGDEEVITSDSADFTYEYGPVAPGKYTFRAEANTEYVDLETTEEATVGYVEPGYAFWGNPDNITVDLSMDASYIEFDVADLGELKARLLVNDEEVDFNLFEEEKFGPIQAEETKVAAEVDFPWGTMMTEADYPGETYRLNFSMNEEMQKEVAKAIVDYNTTYMDGWQKNDTSQLTYVSEDLLTRIEGTFEYYHSYDDYTFEKQNISAVLDKKIIEIGYEDGKYSLLVNMQENYQEDEYYDPQDKGFTNQTNYLQVELQYDEGWKVYNLQDTYGLTIEEPLELDVTEEVYIIRGLEANKEEADENEEEQAEEKVEQDDGNKDEAVNREVEAATLNYIINLVEAINASDYRLVQPYIKDGSALHEMQVDLVDLYTKNGTTQEVVDASVSEIIDNGTNWSVITNESIKIIDASGEEEIKDYVWKYTVVQDVDGFLLINIESTE